MNTFTNQKDSRGIAMFRNGGKLVRGVAAVVIVAFGGLVTSPAVLAARTEIERQAALEPRPQTNAARMSETLAAVRTELRRSVISDDMRVAASGAGSVAADREALRTLQSTLKSQIDEERRILRELEKHIRGEGLSPVILDRHLDAVATFERKATRLLDDLETVIQAPDERAGDVARSVLQRLETEKHDRAQQPFNPRELPNRVLDADEPRKPRTSPEQFISAERVAGIDRLLAANGEFDVSGLVGADDPAYLQATPEVVITDSIRAQAAALDHDPLRILKWVRDNVQWQPTWGAVQDAELTLSAKRGNAFDIASLSIALLRAAGVPARYVHGTIEVDEARFRNWAGGFEHIDAAMEYAASGGVPVASVVVGGAIARVQLEHVWVEVALDFHPSRGVINRAADTWVPFDPAFKQYDFLDGLDPVELSGIDLGALQNDVMASGQANLDEHWVTGFDPAVLQEAQETMQAALQARVAQIPDATIGDVLGGRQIVPSKTTVFTAGLENRVVVAGNRYAQLPANLRQYMTFGFGTDIFGEPEQSVRLPWAELNNERITLSFRPATAADEEALASIWPEGGEGDPSELPTSIPAYLIQVVPELRVGDEVLLSGPAMNLGHELTFVFTPEFAGRQSAPNTYNVIAGSYLAIAAIAGNVSRAAILETQARVEATRAVLESGDETLMLALDREALLGDMFHAGLLGYYGELTGFSYIAGQQQGGHHYLAAGTGSFGYEPEVSYTFGIPRSISGGGAVMNIPMVNVYGYDQPGTPEGQQARLNYILQTGMMSSALEHTVPEQMFRTAGAVTGISAVKALGIASRAGQRVYHVTQANMQDVLPEIHHSSSVMSEIRTAALAGKEVLTHTSAVSVPGWTGAGYVIFDPQTGSGAYKISGGANGGFLDFLDIFSTVFGISFDYKEMLAKYGGANKIADVFGTIGAFMALLGFLVGIVDIALTCSSDNIFNMIVLYTLMTALVIGLTILAGPLGAFAAFAVGLVLGLLSNYLAERLKESSMCV